MTKIRAFKAAVLGLCLAMFAAVPAWAQSSVDTPGEVKDAAIAEATPYFTILVGVVIALFGLALLVTLARKAAGMAKGGIRRG